MADVDLASFVRDIPDFPKPGIGFKDITPVLASAEALNAAVTQLADLARPLKPDVVVGAEARGFLLGAALARELAPASSWPASPASCRTDGACRVPARVRDRRLELHSDAVAQGAASWSTTTCWRPAARRARSASWSSNWTASSSAARS